jgi:hypothetical protein
MEAVLEDDLNPFCMACSVPVDSGTSAVVTDDEFKFSDTSSDLNLADQDMDGWDGDSEFTWPEGDGDTVDKFLLQLGWKLDQDSAGGLQIASEAPLWIACVCADRLGHHKQNPKSYSIGFNLLS